MNVKKKSIIIILISLMFIFIIAKLSVSLGMKNYYNTGFTTGLVTATNLNVREGPGTNYKIVANAKKNEYIRVFAGIGDWYIVQVEGDYIGAVSKKYVKPIYPNTGSTTTSQNTSNGGSTNTTLTADEKEVFDLINNERTKNGLTALKMSSEVQKVARIKAQDMVKNNYFAHESPTYGTPFNMLKNFGVTYKTAGENIAGNSSNKEAVNAWMGSSGHRANILNGNFNNTGIGVVNGSKYGKIYVQMFIGTV